MINNVTMMGRITRMPELKKTPSGISVTNISLAVDRQFSSGSEKITDFFECVAWRNNAEFICKYFKKGDMIAVIGELQTREYQGRDGSKKKAIEIIISQSSFCGGKNETKADDAPPAADPNNSGFPPIDEMPVNFTDDDLPF